MDIFQLIADFLHLLAMVQLLLVIRTTRVTTGLSAKTQLLFLSVFVIRYFGFLFDSPFTGIHIYFSIMKILFLGMTGMTFYLIRFKRPYCSSYSPQADSFPFWVLYGVAFFLTLLSNSSLLGWARSYSIWLESFAIIPQLTILRKTKEVDSLTGQYILMLGLYRALYVVHWFYAFFAYDMLIWVNILGGSLQTALYLDFCYYYLVAKQEQGKFKLPI
ncbi:ER lumen protein-retaining receptor-like [Hippocampus zosterae]|uniref:ER lumen protein-retaining receptor-like n=1 Tax=Hippocampus zosterae TaxID=109293 RepID=UPI00223E7ACC|nr:ER lumen protein-retaining receptor-like [Hippocampus zosterae]